ncbi:hypothetical protein PDE_09180 [Penicillium oxalicum 114-2]|uniref:Uncharacterized protein n=1 Tax=Penicillium oxalicum (strain 114-2 / CGMCC 5302) TaxID=933388 RepID=S7ZZE4_PENO1|nr:hypothetical protein PDE_09180 [Penicillium oxalicum 114-2]
MDGTTVTNDGGSSFAHNRVIQQSHTQEGLNQSQQSPQLLHDWIFWRYKHRSSIHAKKKKGKKTTKTTKSKTLRKSRRIGPKRHDQIASPIVVN